MKVFKNLKAQIKKNDTMTNAGIIFVVGIILPILIAVTLDVINNGSKML
mgnify:FL=1|jgi:hypothetical protein